VNPTGLIKSIIPTKMLLLGILISECQSHETEECWKILDPCESQLSREQSKAFYPFPLLCVEC